MDRDYEVRITDQAQNQLHEILHYVAFELQVPTTAHRLLDTLEESISSLSQQPARFASVKEEPWHGLGIHKMLVKNFLVCYWINEDEREVQVIAVLYARRDQLRMLEDMEIE